MSDTADFFRSRLDQMIELRHPLAVLASRLPRQELEANITHLFAKQVRSGKKVEDVDLFGGVSALVGSGVSAAGRPSLPLRLMISLLYLKHAFNEINEGGVQRWAETPTWQYFSGLDYFEHRWPCDPTALVHFRRALGEEGVEALLQQTINVAVTLKLIAKKHLATVIVDSTIAHKAMRTPPTPGCWLLRAIARKGLKALLRLLPAHIAAAILRLLKDRHSQFTAQLGFRPLCGA